MPFMKSDSNDGCSTKKKNSVACVAHFASASAAFSRLARSDATLSWRERRERCGERACERGERWPARARPSASAHLHLKQLLFLRADVFRRRLGLRVLDARQGLGLVVAARLRARRRVVLLRLAHHVRARHVRQVRQRARRLEHVVVVVVERRRGARLGQVHCRRRASTRAPCVCWTPSCQLHALEFWHARARGKVLTR